MNWLGKWLSGKTGTEYIGTSPYRTSADSSQPPPPQDPDTKEDNKVQCILDTTKTRKQSTLEALEKALFSEQVHKMKKTTVIKKWERPAPSPNTLEKTKGPGEPRRQKSPEVQAQEEPPKEKIAAGASYRGYREADTRAEAEENQVKEQRGATRKRQAVVKKAPVPQTTHRKRCKDGTADGQDQPHPAPHLPTHTVQIGASSRPTAEPVPPMARNDKEGGLSKRPAVREAIKQKKRIMSRSVLFQRHGGYRSLYQ